MSGKKVVLPVLGREIPVIGDPYVDIEFGTGALKITPAHDFNDFEIGLKHGLEQIKVIDEEGRMNENASLYQGWIVSNAEEGSWKILKGMGSF